MSSSPQSPEPPDAAGPDAAGPDAAGHDAAGPDAAGHDAAGAADYDKGVPTFDFVRDRIEGRYATALGTTELAEESAAGRSLAQQQHDRDTAARDRLAEIRRSMGDAEK
jgi:hypothetical protein